MSGQGREDAAFQVERSDQGDILVVSGDWVVSNLASIDEPLRALRADKPTNLTIEMSQVGRLDTAGAFVLSRTAQDCLTREPEKSFRNTTPSQDVLLDAVFKNADVCDIAPPAPRSVLEALERIGGSVHHSLGQARSVLGLCGEVVTALGRILRSPKRLRVTSLVYHMEQSGFDAVPIVSLLTFLIGAVVAFLGSSILRQFGAEVLTVELIAYAVLRELGVLLTAIIVAGRSGSAFTAQIGSMKMNEEIDAMRVLGLDPIEVLVVPRVLAFLIMVPLLAFVADIMGLVGGMLISMVTLDISPSMFFVRINELVPINNFWSGLIKAPFFAFIIALIGCHEGLSVEGSAESVGQRTTQSVVQSIFMVIVINALFAMFYIEVDF